MKITKQLVSSLKETTGAGLHACHKALKAVNGNIEAAIEELKKAGQKLALSKVDRATHEGTIIIRVAENAQKAIMIQVTCETDFVANNEVFQVFANKLAEQAIKNNATTIEALLKVTMENQETIEQARKVVVAKVGENIQISQLQYLKTAHRIGSYIHKGRYGALVELKAGNNNIAKEIAIHVVVSQPSDIAALLKQEFYKDPSQTVVQYLEKQGAEVVQYVLFKM